MSDSSASDPDTGSDPGSEPDPDLGIDPNTDADLDIDEGRIVDTGVQIYPLVADQGNQRVLIQWLEDHDEYEVVDPDLPVSEATFDLCVVDESSLRANRETLKRLKDEAAPVLLPVLLLLPETRSDVIEIDRGEIADHVFATTIDEIVSLPMRQTELGWRIKALLRLRAQSFDLSARTTELRLFRRAIQDSGQAVAITDPDGAIEYVNPAFETTTGYDEESIVGETWWTLYAAAVPEDRIATIESTVEDGEVWDGEIAIDRRSGAQIETQQTLAPVFDEAGQIEAYVGVLRDITERKELERDRKRYQEIVERLEDPIMLQDRDGQFELLNQAVADYAGYDRSELLGEDEYLFMDDETAARIEANKQEVLETGEQISYEVPPTFPKTGEETVFSTSRYPYYNENGELAGTMAICRNVTETKERQAELRQYERAIVGATDLITAIDTDREYLFANPKYREYHGIEATDVSGLPISDVLEGEVLSQAQGNIERALTGETVTYRVRRSHPTRGERLLEARYYPIEEDGETTGVVAVLRDVTDREDRSHQLEVVDRILRHNLRNDLNVVQMQAETIREQGTEPVAEAANKILDRIDGLLTTSEKSRDITQTLTDEVTPSPIDVGRMVGSAVESATETYPQAAITVEGPSSVAAFAAENIGRAISELLTNAVVHNEGDSPSVRVTIESEAEAVRIDVSDDGPGLPAIERDILEEGTEVDELYHGSGLGLWMVHWIVRRSGGSVAVESSDSEGTTVTITLPRHGID